MKIDLYVSNDLTITAHRLTFALYVVMDVKQYIHDVVIIYLMRKMQKSRHHC